MDLLNYEDEVICPCCLGVGRVKKFDLVFQLQRPVEAEKQRDGNSMDKYETEILKLTDLWYSYVGLDVHKDRDCHWYINCVWSYGAKPYYKLEHYGYVYESKNHKHYKTYEQVCTALYSELRKAFRQELEWAKDVIGDKDLYDKIQHDKATWLIKNYHDYLINIQRRYRHG